MRALLVGAGGMGRNWAKNLANNADVQFVGWVDIREGAAQQAAIDLDMPDVITGSALSELIAAVQPDFVVDVSVPEAHHEVTVTALEAGVSVLGEKPMAASMAHARDMVHAAERMGKLYMVSQNRRYNAQIQAYRRLIETHLGQVGLLNADFYIGAHFGGFRDTMASPLLLDMAIHTFDAARFLSGADPVSVYCEEFNPSWSWYAGAACATAIFEMTGGLRFTYRGAWCSEGASTSWESEWRAVGEHGSALWDGAAPPTAEIVTAQSGAFHLPTEPITVTVDDMMQTNIAGSLADFLTALKTGSTPMGECHDNIKSLAMVFGALESAATGQRIKIDV